MATVTLSHFNREQRILDDLEHSFPDFTGKSLRWVHVDSPHDPPDFIAQDSAGTFGLEFREWLHGEQMAAAQGRDRQRKHLMDVIERGWEHEYQPRNVALACIEPRWGKKIAPSDEAALRLEFYECANRVDQGWLINPERVGAVYYQTEFPAYPLMGTYLQAVRYISGAPHGAGWIQPKEDGGAYDPSLSVQTLKDALEDKLVKFSRSEWQARLARHNLSEHYLLIHGGWNAYKNNSPHRPLTLQEIVKRGADFYAAHPQRDVFNRVWFFWTLVCPAWTDTKWRAFYGQRSVPNRCGWSR